MAFGTGRLRRRAPRAPFFAHVVRPAHHALSEVEGRSTVPNCASSFGPVCVSQSAWLERPAGKSRLAVRSCAFDRRHCSHVRSGGHPATPVGWGAAVGRVTGAAATRSVFGAGRVCRRAPRAPFFAHVVRPAHHALSEVEGRSTVPNCASSFGPVCVSQSAWLEQPPGKSRLAVRSCAFDRRHCSHVRSGGHPATPVGWWAAVGRATGAAATRSVFGAGRLGRRAPRAPFFAHVVRPAHHALSEVEGRSTVPNCASSFGPVCVSQSAWLEQPPGESRLAVRSCALDRRHCSHVRSGGHPATPVGWGAAVGRATRRASGGPVRETATLRLSSGSSRATSRGDFGKPLHA